MWDIVARDAPIERIATGFTFTEGPVWLQSRSALLFSDIPRNTIHEWRAETVSALRRPSRHANGNSLDHDGRLLTCEHSGRQVSRTEQDGTISVLASSWDAKRLNSPNDLVVKSDGSIYFTDPPFGIKPEQQELDFSGIYRIDPAGELALLDRSMRAPNGLAFSADEALLYVDDSERKELRVFDVASDGSLNNGRLALDMDNGRPGNPDGMKLDKAGNLFVTGPGGIWVLSPDMEHLGMLELPEIPANCAWGEDGRNLFVTARRSVYKVRCRMGGELLAG
jgi:gluconolactonase